MNPRLQISLTLICLSIAIVSISSVDSAGTLMKVLSLHKIVSGKSTEGIDYNDPNQYESPEDILPEKGKSNIVSKALRYAHKRSEDNLLKRSQSMKETSKSDLKKPEVLQRSKSLDLSRGREKGGDGAEVEAEEEDTRSDEEVLRGACKEEPSKTCDIFVKLVLARSPELQSKIALALRNKDDSVEANKLLLHKLFELAIRDIEENNVDEMLDLAADLLVKRNPYVWVGMKAAKLVMKPVLNAANKKS